jgi:hypothetical protein
LARLCTSTCTWKRTRMPLRTKSNVSLWLGDKIKVFIPNRNMRNKTLLFDIKTFLDKTKCFCWTLKHLRQNKNFFNVETSKIKQKRFFRYRKKSETKRNVLVSLIEIFETKCNVFISFLSNHPRFRYQDVCALVSTSLTLPLKSTLNGLFISVIPLSVYC